MSYDLDVYSPQSTPIEKADLAAALAQCGWRLIFLHKDAFWEDDIAPFLGQTGPLATGSMLVGGWPLDHTVAGQMEALATDRNFREFKALAAATYALATFSLQVFAPFDVQTDWPAEDWQDVLATSPREAQTLLAAHSHYVFVSSGGFHPFGIEYMMEVSEAIAQLSGGTVDNPQGDRNWEEMTGSKPSPQTRLDMLKFRWQHNKVRKLFGL